MARPGFIFGGNTGITPEKLKRDRAVLQALEESSSRTPRNVGEGIGAIGQALAYRVRAGRLAKDEKAVADRTAANWARIGSELSANGGGMGFGSATGPIGSTSPTPQGTSTASIPSGERAAYIRSGLTSRGLPDHIADGFLANFQDESGLDSGINERNPIVPGSRGGFGLYQLTGPRRREYEAYASQRGVDPSDVDAQMDFLVGELQGSERAAAEKIFATTDTAGAAQAIVTNFLRPAAEHRNSRVARYAGLGGGMQASQKPVEVASLDPSAGVTEATGTVPYTGPPLRDPNEAISIAPAGMPGSSDANEEAIRRFHAENGTTPVQYGQGAPSGPVPGNVVGERPDMQSNAIASALGIVGQPQPRGMTPVAAALAGQQAIPAPTPAPRQVAGLNPVVAALNPQLGSSAPTASGPSDPWTGLRDQDGGGQPVQVAQAGGGPPQRASGADMQGLLSILADPFATEDQRAVVSTIIEQQMKRNAPAEPIEINGRLVDPRSGRVIADYSDPKTATVGGNVIDTSTGRVIYQGQRDPIEVGGTLIDPQTMKPVYQAPAAPFTLNPGETRFDGAGNQIAAGGTKPGYRTLTADEVGRLGLPKGSYQVGPDGKVEDIGSKGQTINVGGGENKQVFDAMAESAAAARSAATGLGALSEAKRALDAGIITGAGADWNLGLQKIGAALGVVDPTAIQNTETFRASIAPQVAAVMKATVGSANISNSDREFAEKAAGGSINLDAGSIRRLVDIMDRASRAAIQSHIERLDAVYPGGQQFDRERALFGVRMPEALSAPDQQGQAGGAARAGSPMGGIPSMTDTTPRDGGQGSQPAVRRARNPQTGQTLELRNGQWVVVQ